MRNLLTSLFVFACLTGKGQIIFKDWNSGTLAQGGFFIQSCVGPNNPAMLTDSFSTPGDYAAYASVSKSDSICGGSNRTEWNVSSANFASVEWVQWDVYIPTWVPVDSRPFSSGQIHGSVNVPFYLKFENGNNYAVIQNSKTNSSSNLTTNVTYALGPYKRGAWQRYLIHFKRSIYSDGFIEMWVDGVFKFRYNGPTVDVVGGVGDVVFYWKGGIYKWNLAASAFDKAAAVTDNYKQGGPATVLTDFYPDPLPPPDPLPTGPGNGGVRLPWIKL